MILGLILGLALGALIGFLIASLVRSQNSGDQVAELAEARAEVASLTRRLEDQADDHKERMALLEANRKQLTEEMKNISGEAMRSASKQLAEQIEERQKLERERSKNELERRTTEIKNTVNPVKEKLGEVGKKVEELEQQRVKAQGELTEQIRSLKQGVGELADSAGGLTAALRKPTGRGSWGEIQLRNAIELAGLIEHCDFETQVSVRSSDGLLRPDVVVNMPGGTSVVIDAKVPMEAFLDAQACEDGADRDELLTQHARQVKSHIDALRAKSYQEQFESSPELVVMFLPSEGIYHAALAADSQLLHHGLNERVLIATPTTLIGLLRAIAFGWRQQQISDSAKEIASIGRELHKRILTFADPLSRAGRSLGTAVDHYNRAVGSYDARVVPQLRRIEEAGAGSGNDVDLIDPVDAVPRTVTTSAEAQELEEGELAEAELVEDSANGSESR